MRQNKEILWSNTDVKMHPQVKVVGQVYIGDFNKLENAEGQRSLTAQGLKGIGDSFNDYGICSCPIVVKRKNKYIVIDGWHRVYVAKKNNWHIICTIVESEYSINDLMIVLNTTQQNWSTEAYLNNGIVYHKNQDYVFLRELHEEIGVSLTALYHIFNYDSYKAKSKQVFELGTWKATTKPLGTRVLKYAEELHKYMPFSYKSRFLEGYVKCVSKKSYDHKHMMEQVKKFPNHIHDGDRPGQHAEMINKVYNHRCLEEKQTYLI